VPTGHFQSREVSCLFRHQASCIVDELVAHANLPDGRGVGKEVGETPKIETWKLGETLLFKMESAKLGETLLFKIESAKLGETLLFKGGCAAIRAESLWLSGVASKTNSARLSLALKLGGR